MWHLRTGDARHLLRFQDLGRKLPHLDQAEDGNEEEDGVQVVLAPERLELVQHAPELNHGVHEAEHADDEHHHRVSRLADGAAAARGNHGTGGTVRRRCSVPARRGAWRGAVSRCSSRRWSVAGSTGRRSVATLGWAAKPLLTGWRREAAGAGGLTVAARRGETLRRSAVIRGSEP